MITNKDYPNNLIYKIPISTLKLGDLHTLGISPFLLE